MIVFLKFFLFLYIETFLFIIVHELFHILAALCMGIEIEKVQIGKEGLLSLSINERLSISPIICGGYVDVSLEQIVNKGYAGIFVFGCSGFLGNIVTILIVISIKRVFILYRLWALIFNICIVITSIIPFFKGDAFTISELLRKVKK